MLDIISQNITDIVVWYKVVVVYNNAPDYCTQ